MDKVMTILKPTLKNLALGQVVSTTWLQRSECVVVTFLIHEIYIQQESGNLFAVYPEKNMDKPLMTFHSSELEKYWGELYEDEDY